MTAYPTQPGGQPYYPQPGGQPYNPQPGPNYNTMGGWFLFFMILCLLDAVIGIIGEVIPGGMITDIRWLASGDMYGPDKAVTVCFIIAELVILAACVLEILFVVQALTRKPTFLRFYQICKIAVICATLLEVIVVAVVYKSAALGIATYASIVGSIAGVFLMTLYYSRSKRVRTYMGSDEYKHRALFSFKDQVPVGSPAVSQPYYPQAQPQPPAYGQPYGQPPSPAYGQPYDQVAPQQSQPPAYPYPPQQQAPYQEYGQPAQAASAPYGQYAPQPAGFCATCGTPYAGGEAQCQRCGAPRQ